jgi:hypothetical protein
MTQMTHPMSNFFNSASRIYTLKTDGYRTMSHHVALLGLLPYARAQEGKQKSKKCVMWGMGL